MGPFRVELADANAFIEKLHRHHKPVVGHRFSLGAERNGILVGVAIVGRPVARACDHRTTAEVLRLCTDGTRNACSYLYGLSAKVAGLMGFSLIQTYILDSEPGTSLAAAGWEVSHTTRGRSWNTPARGGRRDDQPQCDKVCWVKRL